MLDSPFIELLAKQSASRLREMLEQYEEDEQRIAFERAYVERALARKGASARDESDEKGAGSAGRSHDRAKAASRSRRGDGKREVVRRIMETKRDAVWLPSEVRDVMISEGTDTNAASVRAVMKRMLEEGELERPGEGEHGFRLAVATARLPSFDADGSENGHDASHSSEDTAQRGLGVS